jgi:hypothetical protein
MDREVINPSYELDLRPEEDVDFEFLSPNQFVGPNVGLIPLQNAVQPTRLFYGARFANQAQPLVRPEAPWVQTATDDAPDLSFDDMLGKTAGALRADQDATVEDVTDQQISLRYPDGKQKRISLYRNMPFNRYSGITQTPTVKKGQTVKANALLARSNFTDENGSLALGLNARIGVVPFKGFSMDDAMVVSDAFAKRATSLHLDSFDKDFSTGNLKGGQDHFKSLFPDLYTRDQLATLDSNGVVQPGQIVQPGDPLVLASRPRNFNSAQSQSLGRLGKVARQLRADASLKWESDVPGTVTDVIRKKDGTVRVMIESHRPMMLGDKAVLRSGQKGVVSKIIPEHEMPRTASGEPLDMLLNQQGLPSRANPSLLLEILLGKVAAKTGKPLKLPAFNPEQDSWVDFVAAKLKEVGMTDKETVYDPKDNRKLDRPITVGNAYVLKLHHIAEHKYSARGQGAYDAEGQPSKGPGDGGGAKRRSGLESNVMLSSGAYKNLRESSTLTGQQCFDSSTEVMTYEGWKYWDTVTAQDQLLTRSTDDPTTAWYESPERMQKHQFDGNLLGYEGRHLDWLVTPNHKFWGVPCVVSRSKPWYRQRFFMAEQVAGKAGSVAAFGATYSGDIPDDFVVDIPAVAGTRSTGMKIPLVEYCRLLGWWLSEGSASVNKKDGSGRITLSQTQSVNPIHFREIELLLHRLGFDKPIKLKRSPASGKNSIVPYVPSKVGEIIGLRVCNRSLAEHLLTFGSRSWKKRVPPLLFRVSPAMRLEFMRCYAAGDGCIRYTGKAAQTYISTSSSGMQEDLQRLAVLTGLAAFNGVCNGVTYKRPHYRVILEANVTDLSFVKRPATQFKGHYVVPFSGKVYCATMRTGMLFVRRNGKCMWSGNSDDFWRTFRSGQTPKTPGRPFVFDKFRALLNGAGMHTQDKGGGKLRLGLLTDKQFEQFRPLRVQSGETIDFRTQAPKPGGLFDPALVANKNWGYIDLPEPMPNPAAEDTIRQLLGLTGREFEEVLAGTRAL